MLPYIINLIPHLYRILYVGNASSLMAFQDFTKLNLKKVAKVVVTRRSLVVG